ncbi:alpha/beta fold hydrolase [Streptomyces echinatus]|uniref:alpha/beta fold hydrolase n=1 Tax=Streptomyces echinatus TaxID=67293 RepID=UPI003798B3CE
MRVTSDDGVRIAFEVVGSGPPLVLLHGFFGDRTTWRSAGYVDALAEGHRLVLIDARGHGGSDSPHDVDSYRIDRQAGDVVAVLDALDIARAAFWGASMGGIIGLNLLAGHPERLTALIAGGAHGGPVTAVPAEVQQEIGLFRSRGTAPFIEMLERQGPLPAWMRVAMQAADPYALAALTAALGFREGVLERLVRTSMPVLLLAGDRDSRLQSIRDTAARIPDAICAEMPGCGHLDTFLRLDLALPVVRPFLARYAAG